MINITALFAKSKVKTIFIGLILLFVSPSPLFASTESSGDYILFFDSSISLRQFRPDVVPSLWIKDFLGRIPDESNLIVAGFSEGIDNITEISAEKFNSDALYIPSIALEGLATDFAAPLQYLVDYQGDIALAAIISDGEPEIWDELRYHLSKTVLKNPSYANLNLQYQQLYDQGVTKEELYSQLNNKYTAKNIEIIQQYLTRLDEKLGENLIFVDLYGELPFINKWTVNSNIKYFISTAQEQPLTLDELHTPLIKPVKEKITMADPIMPPTPNSDTSKPVRNETPSMVIEPTEKVADIKTAPEIDIKSAEMIASAIVSSTPKTVEVEVYKTDFTITFIAILISAIVFIVILFTKEKKYQKALFDHHQKQKELFGQIESEAKLKQDISEAENNLNVLEKNITALKLKKDNLDQEISANEEQLKSDKDSIEVKLEDFEKELREKIESEIEQYSQKERNGLHEDLKHTSVTRLSELDKEVTMAREARMSEIEKEANDQKKINSDTLSDLLKTETKKIELDIKRKKDAEETRINQWIQQLSKQQKGSLKNDLTKMEQESQERIKEWEEDAEQRTLSLLDTKYKQNVEDRKGNIKLLKNAYDLLITTVSSMQEESDQLEVKIADQRQHLDKLMSTEVDALKKKISDKEDSLWQKISFEIQREKEKTIKRIHEREKESI